MKTLLSVFLIVGLVLTLALSGCRQKTLDAVEESIQSAEDNALVENEFASVFENVDNEAETNPMLFGGNDKSGSNPLVVTGKSELLSDCTVVTVDSAAKKITIDFGTTNCLCRDGLYRRGKVYAQFNGKYKAIGSSVNISLENYYVQDNYVTGTKTISRIGDQKWGITVQNAGITTDNGTISWNAQRTIERLEGGNTPTVWDDIYLYEGSAIGINRKGVGFSVTIEQPLKKVMQLGCYRNFEPLSF
ncbi:MAG: hypothetical protein QG635_2068 [Bacteroidota bacterium]|nr:hypothetical protein [Bacteroidota bacterium]